MKTTFTNSGVMRNLFKLITLTIFLTLASFAGVSNAWGASPAELTWTSDITHNESANGESDDFDVFTASYAKSTGPNDPVYWNKSSTYGIKLYATKNTSKGNSITISTNQANIYITKIEVTGSTAQGTCSLYWDSSTSTTGTSKTYTEASKTQSSTFALKETGNSKNGQYIVTKIKVTYVSATATPTLTVSESSISGLTYVQGSGPSTAQTFTISGSNLTSNVTVTAPTNFEVSKDGSSYAGSQTTTASGTLSATTIYVRLKSGLAVNSYSGNITVASTGATSKTVSLSGSVTEPVVTCPNTPTVSFPTDAITKYMGDGKFTFAPTITGNDLEAGLTYSSNKTSCATVDPSTGEVTIVNATGSGAQVTITATLAAVDDGDDCQNSVSASYTLTIYNKVTWLIDGEPAPAGSQTTYTTEGGSVTAFPTDPDGDAVCSGKTFVGWTTSECNGDVAPSPLYTSDSDMSSVHITDNTTYYAVFAEGSGGEETEASYIFNTNAGLTALGITKPASGQATNLSGTYTVGDITMSFTSGGTATRVWNSSGSTNLRVYGNGTKNGTLTFSSAENITTIVFTGSITCTANVGTYSAGTWTGEATSVTFTFTANSQINTITVTSGAGASYSDYSTTCGNCLAAPEPVVTARTDNVILSWAAVEGATGYTVTCSSGTVVVSGTTATITGLASETEYTYTIQSVGPTPPYDCFPVKNGSFTTPGATIDIVEWQENAAVIYVDKEEGVNPLVIIDGEVEHGSISGKVATDLFFSKYFEGEGNIKMFAIFNGTDADINLEDYSILIYNYNNSNIHTSDGNNVTISFTSSDIIYQGQEIIFYSKDDNVPEVQACSNSFFEGIASQNTPSSNPRWIEKSEIKAAISGNDYLQLLKNSTPIDIFGATTEPSGKNCRSEWSWSGRIQNMDYGKTAADFPANVWSNKSDYGINVEDEEIDVHTARCVLYRNKVTSGSDAVAGNIDAFNTLTPAEWYGRNICSTGVVSGAGTCNSYKDLGEFDYNNYYKEYETISEDTYLDSYSHNPETGEYTIPIDNLSQYSCLNLRFQLKQGDDVLTENAVQVPIIVKGNKTTADAIFNEIVEDKETHEIQYDKSIERCQTCNVVVLGDATLTKATDGATHDVPQIRDLTIYPGGKLVVPSSTNYTVHSLALRRQEDAISLADIKGNLSVGATNGVYFDLRIDPTNWHYITLPYDCNVKDITFSDGTTAELGKDYQIAWYDGAYRAANKDGGWTDVTAGTTLKKGLGYIVCLPGAGKVRKELRFPMANGVIAAEKANKTVSYVYAYGGDQSDEDLRPNHKGWNLLGNPYMMYYNTDITTPLKTGTLEQDPKDPNLWVLNTTGAKNVRYLVEPINNGWSGYRQIPITTHMPPFTSYFVQVGGANPATAQSVSFNVAKSGLSNIVARREAAEDIEDNHPIWYGLQLLAPNNEKDNTTLLISDDFTDDYDMMDDLVKMRGSYYKYYDLPILSSRNNEGEMAFNALPDQSAAVVGVPLTYYAAQAGTYTFMTDGQFDLEEVKSAFLFDVTTNQYYNLLSDNYSFETAKGNNEDRFRLFVAVERQNAPDIVTDDNLLDEGQLSLTSIDHTLLLSGLTGMADIYVYDMSGKLLRGESVKNQNGVWRTPVSLPGVYFVRVNNALGQQTLRAIVK